MNDETGSDPGGTGFRSGSGAQPDGVPFDRADSHMDRAMRSGGAELRAGAPRIDGGHVMAAQREARVQRWRFTSFVAVGVAAAMIATAVGFALRDGGSAEFAAGAGGFAPGSPEAIVDALPAEPVDPHDVELVASVSTFEDCDALVGDLRRVGAAHVGSQGFGNNGPTVDLQSGGDISTAGTGVAPQPSFTGPDAVGTGGDETLGTNVIVDGVDEPDTVKASGSLIVELHDGDLRVVDTTAGALVGTIDLASDEGVDLADGSYAYPQSFLLEGTLAVVFGGEVQTSDPVEGDPSAARPAVEYATVTFVDLADPTAPVVTDRARIEGSLVAARRVDGAVRIVTASTMSDLPLVLPTNPNSVPVALEQNRLAVAGSGADDWIPAWDRGAGTDPEPLVPCTDVVVPDTFAGVQMTSLVEFDMAGPFQPRSTGILAPSTDITATATDVVVASHIWVDPADRDDDFSDWSTALHRFTFGAESPSYVASGEVPGSVRDDFSMGVLDDTTIGVLTVDVVPWERSEEAEVTARTLRTDGGVLVPLGTLPIAAGSSSTGMRFIGDRLVVSSGLAGNHVSVVDLSEPAEPVLAGEVDTEGSGAYFHPVSDERILVVGKAWRPDSSGDPNTSAPRDLTVTLLDVSGPPRSVTTWRLDNADNYVGQDHHRFTWWPQRSTAAFGVRHTSPAPNQFPPPPDAAFLEVAGDVITPRLVRPSEADLGPSCPITQSDRTGCDDSGQPVVDRVLVVDGTVWLHTGESVEQVDPLTGASLKVVALPPR